MNEEAQFLMYRTKDGETRIDVRLEDETVWMIQKLIAQLYQKSIPTINEHIKNIYKEKELNEQGTVRKNLIVQKEGKRDVEREVSFYNLKMFLAVGYQVRSQQRTQFWKWAKH